MNGYRDNARVIDDEVVIRPRTQRGARIIGALVMIAVGGAFSCAMPIATVPIIALSIAMAWAILKRFNPCEDGRRQAVAEAQADAWMRGYDVIRSR